MDLKNFISVYDDIMPKKTFNILLKVCKNLDWEKATISKNELNEDIRITEKCDLEDISNSMTTVHWFHIMKKCFKYNIGLYVHRNNIKNIYRCEVESIQVLKYSKFNHYTWHCDSSPINPRTFSCIYFLNENYEGGELCFRNPDGTGEFIIPKKENRMIIWPSSFLYPHTVKPVTNGERYTIVSWTH
jgi:hypothetical protein